MAILKFRCAAVHKRSWIATKVNSSRSGFYQDGVVAVILSQSFGISIIRPSAQRTSRHCQKSNLVYGSFPNSSICPSGYFWGFTIIFAAFFELATLGFDIETLALAKDRLLEEGKNYENQWKSCLQIKATQQHHDTCSKQRKTEVPCSLITKQKVWRQTR